MKVRGGWEGKKRTGLQLRTLLCEALVVGRPLRLQLCRERGDRMVEGRGAGLVNSIGEEGASKSMRKDAGEEGCGGRRRRSRREGREEETRRRGRKSLWEAVPRLRVRVKSTRQEFFLPP